MISGLLINPLLELKSGPQLLEYTLDPYTKAEGPLRSMQKFAIILMTTQGTDSLHPWFGTKLPKIMRMNIANTEEMQLFVQDQVTSAIQQFFRLQAEEYSQNASTADDVIDSVELIGIEINEYNQITVTIQFTSHRYASIAFSMKVS